MLRRRRSDEAHGTPRRRIRKLRLLLLLLLLAIVASTAFLYGLVTAIGQELPSLDPVNAAKVQENGYVYDRTGKNVLAVLRGEEVRVVVKSDEIADIMKQAMVAVEDRRYWEHQGIDVRGIFRAVWADLQNKEVAQGGSTITQQLIKQTLLGAEVTVSRKIKEAALAWQMERKWSKDRILTAYLNTVFFANNAYGVEMAARVYFSKKASELTLPEAALLAGIVKNPSRFDPVRFPENARKRRETVLSLMLEQAVITREEFLTARNAPMPNPDDVRLPGVRGQKAGYFTDYVIFDQLVPRYGASRVFGGGFKVRTSIDLDLQEKARSAIEEHLGAWLQKPIAEGGMRAALVAMDPQTGEVLAMVGGSNYHAEQFNLATDGFRQPGSTFKPVVLAAALDSGISPHMTYASVPQVIVYDGQYVQVRNYDSFYLGRIDLISATKYSDNAVYAQLTKTVGPTRVADMAERLGVTTPLNGYFSIGLGGEYVRPLEMARAYSTFAFTGRRVDGSVFGNQPRAVLDMTIRGKEVENERRIFSALKPNDARWVNAMLQGVVRGGGTGRRAYVPGRVVAGKTGTTDSYADAWFVGYTPQLAVAIWVGYPKGFIPMTSEYFGDPVAGGTFPAEIFRTFMTEALKGKPLRYFESPRDPGFTLQRVLYRDGRLQKDNGKCEGTSVIAFSRGRVPTRVAPCKENEVVVPDVRGLALGKAEDVLASRTLQRDELVYVPAKPGERVGVVVNYEPKKRVSAYDQVTLWVTTASDGGKVPNLVGRPLLDAQELLTERKLVAVLPDDAGDLVQSALERAVVVGQSPKANVAAAPGMAVQLTIERGEPDAGRSPRS